LCVAVHLSVPGEPLTILWERIGALGGPVASPVVVVTIGAPAAVPSGGSGDYGGSRLISTGRRRLVRRVLRAGALLVAAAAVIAGGASVAVPHHALADNGVIDSRN
jgi:hypothetical protein